MVDLSPIRSSLCDILSTPYLCATTCMLVIRFLSFLFSSATRFLFLHLASEMESASGSESHPVRQMRPSLTRGFLQRHRHRTQAVSPQCRPGNFPGHHVPVTSRGSSSSCPRHKRCTETIFLTGEDVGGRPQQENRPLHLEPTNPSAAADTSRLEPRPFALASCNPSTFRSLPRARQFSATARSVTAVSTAPAYPFAAASSCARSEVDLGQSSVAPKPSFPFRPLRPRSTNGVTPVDQRSGGSPSTSSAPRKPRPPRIKVPAVKSSKAKGPETSTSGSASPPTHLSSSSVPSRFPAIFNVGHADLAPGIVTCTTEVSSTYRDRPDSFSDFSTTSPSDFLFPSFDALDDLTRWDIDMDTFQSLPTSNKGKARDSQLASSNNDSHANKPDHSNPFSTPFGDDDLLQDEIPFPTTRHRVVIENMGVKKSKTLAVDKARNLTNSGLGFSFPTTSSRQYVHPFMSSDPSASPLPPKPPPPTLHQRPPPHLPHPLPLLQSADSPNPLDGDSIAQTSTYLHPPRTAHPSGDVVQRNPDVPSSPSRDPESFALSPAPTATSEAGNERLRLKRTVFRSQMTPDPDGCHHLGPEDCELLIMFPRTAHYEVWDMDDHGCASVPALLCLMAKDPRRWSATPLAMPDVSLIELRCDDRALPVPFPSLCPPRRTLPSPASSPTLLPRVAYWLPHTYSTSFLGGKSALGDDVLIRGGRSKTGGMSMMSALKKREEEQAMKQDKISLDGKWVRTLEWPGIEGPHSRPSHASAHRGYSSVIPPRGWQLRFWVPIPTRLFMKRETRIFRISAKVWMMGDENVAQPAWFEDEDRSKVTGSDESVSYLLAEAEMTVSHLRTERELER